MNVCAYIYICIWSTVYKARIKRLRKTQGNIFSGYRESTLVFKSKTKKNSVLGNIMIM